MSSRSDRDAAKTHEATVSTTDNNKRLVPDPIVIDGVELGAWLARLETAIDYLAWRCAATAGTRIQAELREILHPEGDRV